LILVPITMSFFLHVIVFLFIVLRDFSGVRFFVFYQLGGVVDDVRRAYRLEGLSFGLQGPAELEVALLAFVGHG